MHNRAMKERGRHLTEYQNNSISKTAVNAAQAFDDDNRKRLSSDVYLLKHAILYYPREMKAMTSQSAKPEQIEKFFYDIARRNKMTYYPGVSGYFGGDQ